MRANNIKLAILYSLLAAFFYAFLGTLIKITEKSGATNEMIVFFRQTVGLITLSPFLMNDHKKFGGFKTDKLHLHILRVVASLSSMYCLVFALRYLPLVDALLLTYTRPLFIPIVVFIWFRKKWKKTTWLGLIVGFLGVTLILKPDKKMFDIAALIGLASAMFGAVAFTCIRRLTKTDSANKILLYYLGFSIPIAAVPLISNWNTPSPKEWILLCVIGICGMIYQMTLTRAYQFAKAFKVASMLYSTIFFAAGFDYWLGDFSMDLIGLVGIVLVIVGTVITIKQGDTPFPPETPNKRKKKS
ncbi:MAG: Pseudopaline exporter CntI [Chlamydiia bacterium]|nr:Pseudopaline exporter CntI [Chlamydiia bacterium]